MITEENQDWNREVMDHIHRRDDGWPPDRIITWLTGGAIIVWSVIRR
jgi:hypothetical protein